MSNYFRNYTPLICKLITKIKRGIREKEQLGLIHHAQYAHGMLRAFDIAKKFGKKMVTVCEFGVASGEGLCNMIEIAPYISKETGIKIHIVGFDTGEGIPEKTDNYKDHPENWSVG